MNSNIESSPTAPSGVDPDVLSQIDALFREPKMVMRPALRRRDNAGNPVRRWKKAVPSPLAHNNTTADSFRLPSPEDDLDEDEPSERDAVLTTDQSLGSEVTSSSITPSADPNAPKFMARYVYPSERRPGPLSPALPLPSPPPPLPPSSETNLAHWPNITFLIMSSIQSVMDFIMGDSTPGVIEYSASEVKQKMNEIQVEARIAEAPNSSGATTTAPEKVIGIVALVSVGENRPPQAVSIFAKPKRVRQLLKDYGAKDMAEDVYGLQIKQALMSLRRAD